MPSGRRLDFAREERSALWGYYDGGETSSQKLVGEERGGGI